MSNVSGCGCGSSTPAVSSDYHSDPCKKPCDSAPKDCSPCPPKDCYQTEIVGGIEFVKLLGGTVQLGSYHNFDANPRHYAKIQSISVARTEVTNDQMEVYIQEMGRNTHAHLAKDSHGNIKILKRGTELDLNRERNYAWDVEVKRQLERGALKYLGVFRVVPPSKADRYGKFDGLSALSAEFYRGNNPATRVTWYESFGFTEYLSRKIGCNVRLPTGDEWEYAARGTDALEYATRTGQLTDYNGRKLAHYDADSTTAVGRYPNPFGISDMTGNVWEWTSDWWDNNNETYRVVRGASWDNVDSRHLRTAFCDFSYPDSRDYFIGLRVVVAGQDSR